MLDELQRLLDGVSIGTTEDSEDDLPWNAWKLPLSLESTEDGEPCIYDDDGEPIILGMGDGYIDGNLSEYIVAAVNAMPALLSRLRAADALRDACDLPKLASIAQDNIPESVVLAYARFGAARAAYDEVRNG